MFKGIELYCDQCKEKIEPGEKLKAQRKPGTPGNVLADFYHFHARRDHDCYWQYLRDRVLKLRAQAKDPIQAT